MTESNSSPMVVRDDAATIYFLSDVHLGGSPPEAEKEKRKRLNALFDRVEREDASLYVLGDLFDFWFEYRTVIPATAFEVLARLGAMARGDRGVSYLGGNHDFWLCDFLRRETPIRVLPDGVRLDAQGRRAILAHGDGLGPGDGGYKILKKILRNGLAIRLFRWIHPDVGIRLALWSSGTSRHYTADHPVDTEGLFRNVGRPALAGGGDAFLMGHHHAPTHFQRPEGDFLILGEWFRRYTCARLREGQFELLEWPLDQGHS